MSEATKILLQQQSSKGKDRALFLRSLVNVRGFSNIRGTHSASSRLQLEPAAKACECLGLKPEGLSLSTDYPQHIDLIDEYKLCIIGKIAAKKEEEVSKLSMANLAAVSRIKAKKIPIITTYSDHMIKAPEGLKKLHHDLLKLSDIIVYPSSALMDKTNQWLDIGAKQTVIEDPWQVKEYPFYKDKTQKIRLIWFGHESNLSYLFEILPDLYKAVPHNLQARLTILTSEYGLRIVERFLDTESLNDQIEIRKVSWNAHNQPNQLETEMQDAEFCILPSDKNDERKCGASHNRIVDAIRSGCITIASPLPSYIELRKLALITDDIQNGLRMGISQQKRLREKYTKERPTKLDRFDPKNNQLKWKECIQHALLTRKD